MGTQADATFLLDGKVELRPDHRGEFDELVLHEDGECRVHFEMMDDNVLWIGIYPKGVTEDSVHVTVSARGKLSVVAQEA